MEKNKKKKILLFFKVGIIILILIFVGIVFAINQISKLAKNLPDPQKSGSWQMQESTKIYDKTGKVLLYEVNENGKRTVISLDQIPKSVKEATLALEDQDFYKHSAIDWKSVIRALTVNLIKGQFSQGGSTITQQLAKNTFLTPEKTISRKVKEIILAYWIEKYYSKDQILNLYFNQISYGAGAYGVESASQTYFGKSAKDLSLAEAATLASIPQLPTYYSPWGPHLAELLKRKNYALEQMYSLGYINKQEKEVAQNTPLKFMPQSIGNIKAPHFSLMVKEYLVDKYGEDVVNRGGLKIITSLDFDMQQIAEKAVKDGATRNAELYKGNNASLVAQDGKTGQILALVGSANYFDKSIEGNFNVATQGLRQPGSSIKPFIYMTAFKKGYSPDTVVFDSLTNFDTSGNFQNSYIPENYDYIYRGPVSLRTALAQSLNVPAVKTLYLAGINDSVEVANSFGLSTLTDPKRYGLTLVLGGGEIRLIDMVEAYSVFSQEGIKRQQSFILSVEDSNGTILEKYFDKSTQVIEPQYPRLINDILSDNEARKPLFQNSFDLTTFPDRQVALKTGTTNDYRDAWVFGYTPSLIVGVWAGNNHQEPMQKNAGSILAAVPIWHDFMAGVLPKMPIETFTKPDPISESKPMLNSQYNINGQIHNILYYVDKNNPLGAQPINPANDPQYNNWETGVINWLNSNPIH